MKKGAGGHAKIAPTRSWSSTRGIEGCSSSTTARSDSPAQATGMAPRAPHTREHQSCSLRRLLRGELCHQRGELALHSHTGFPELCFQRFAYRTHPAAPPPAPAEPLPPHPSSVTGEVSGERKQNRWKPRQEKVKGEKVVLRKCFKGLVVIVVPRCSCC